MKFKVGDRAKVFGFDNYLINKQGDVVRNMGGGETRACKSRRNVRGYHSVRLYKAGAKKPNTRMVHVLVLESFVGERPSGLWACHKNDNKEDNNLKNLYWATPKQNQLDREINGRGQRGERNQFAKLAQQEVNEIRRLYTKGKNQFIKGNSAQLAKKFGVSATTITGICNGRSWIPFKAIAEVGGEK